MSAAIYAAFRALEFGWNCAEEGGMIWGWEKGANGKAEKMRSRPWWWGSWMLQPFVFGQLLHAAVFDPDCFPKVSLRSDRTYFIGLWDAMLIGVPYCRPMATLSSSTRRHISPRDPPTHLRTSNGPVRTTSSKTSRRWRASTGRKWLPLSSYPISPVVAN